MNRSTRILRWVLILPVAFLSAGCLFVICIVPLAFLLARLIPEFGVSWTSGFMRYLLVREGILALVWGLAAFCFVFFGTATAPGHKMRTAVSLAAFITLYSVSLLASADDRLHQAVQALPSMAGAWVAVLVVRKKMPAKTSP